MNEMQDTIKKNAIKLFSEKGYHGTSIRDIVNASGCTQPTLYYYYQDKQTLFREVVLGEFKCFIEKIILEKDKAVPIKDFYVQAIIRRKKLTDYEKMVYKLAIQVWYGLIDDEEAHKQLRIWGYKTIQRVEKHLAPYFEDSKRLHTFINLMMNVFMNITEQIVMTDYEISDEEIDERLTMLFKLI